jgi:hypothetical protein
MCTNLALFLSDRKMDQQKSTPIVVETEQGRQ